jgi:hypothetical protein
VLVVVEDSWVFYLNTLSLARNIIIFIQSTPSQAISVRSILILSSNIRICLLVVSLPQVFLPKPCITQPILCATWPAHHILLDFFWRVTFGGEYRNSAPKPCITLSILCATWPAHHILLDFFWRVTFGEEYRNSEHGTSHLSTNCPGISPTTVVRIAGGVVY